VGQLSLAVVASFLYALREACSLRWPMNAHIQDELNEIAKKSEAIISCPICRNYMIIADDDDAESQAYAMATNAWKRGDFRSASLEEVRAAMKSVLRDANFKCPSCDRDS
jgi:hypothetical protein